MTSYTSTRRGSSPLRYAQQILSVMAIVAVGAFSTTALRAQAPALMAANLLPVVPIAMAALPEAPAPARTYIAPKYADLIRPDESAQPLTGREKAILGFYDSVGLTNIAGIVLSAGYSQVRNGEPNYGTNSAAFGQRVGASFVRDFSQEYFTDAIFAPLLRQDPRQYIEGHNHNAFHRILYGATRPLITRNDSGKDTLNSSLLLGYASATALTYAYYPSSNRNFHDSAATFGGSIGGAALGDVIDEFAGSLLHHRHR